MAPQVVLLFGRPGVGKFTVGRILAEETGFGLLHNHAIVDLVAALFPFGSPPFVAMRERLWTDVVEMALAAGLPGLILTFAPERTVNKGFLKVLTFRVRERGGVMRLIELRCEPKELERRLVDPSREAFGKLRDVTLYRELESKGAFDLPMPAPELAVDTDVFTPAEAAKLIASHLRDSK